jgi:hypothetical protein
MMAGYVESPIPDKALSEGFSVVAAIKLPQLIVREAVVVDFGKIAGPRMSLLLRNWRLVGRLELDPATRWELNGPTLQSVLQAIPSGDQVTVLQVTKFPRMEIWLNGRPGAQMDLPPELPGTISGTIRLLASFEQDRPAADITVGMYLIGNELSEEAIKRVTRRVLARLRS